jgi:hypothetical protein
LFAPRLVRWRLEARRKAPAELQKAHEELAELRLRPPPQPGLVVTTSSSTLLLIRAYMDETGAELAEAKAAVEKLLGKA